jgi:transcriptional regulator with XRE-family HTH domain
VSITTDDQLYDAFGAYVRSQRQLARLTLRQAAELARISNPYLSQIEHGLALPSIAVLSSLAEALSVSAETMLLRAAGLAHPGSGGALNQTEDSIRQDSRLDNSQKRALLAVLASFVGSSPDHVHGEPAVSADSAVSVESAMSDESAVSGSAHVVTPRGTSPRMSGRPAVSRKAASPRRKGV